MNVGVLILGLVLAVLAAMAALRGRETSMRALKRGIEQFALLVPRLICALIAAGFIAKLIPSEFVARFLGAEAGLVAILIGTAAGLLIPAGPVVAFSIAAVFARSGASAPALIAFVTSWSLFAAHRIFIFELPLLGGSFFRLRVLSVGFMPVAAGAVALILGAVFAIAPTLPD